MNKFAIILGEPNSINSEILAKSIVSKKRSLIIGSSKLLKSQFNVLKIKKKIYTIKSLAEVDNLRKNLNVLDVPLKFKKPFEVKPKESSKYIKKCFNLAHKLCVQKKLKGFINCAVDKKNLFKNKNIGITEFLSKKNSLNNSEVMMIYNKKLSVAPLTTHIELKNVPKSLKMVNLKKKIVTLNNFYIKYFKIKPRIAVLGLNPHNSELKKNSEETKIIIPMIKSLKKNIKLQDHFLQIQRL